jgi:hypothetical protein
LDVSKNTALTYLSCYNDQLTAGALNNLFGSLPVRTSFDGAYIAIFGNPGASTCDRSIAEAKGWSVQ